MASRQACLVARSGTPTRVWIDLEKDSGSATFNADIEMNGPFLGVNFLF